MFKFLYAFSLGFVIAFSACSQNATMNFSRPQKQESKASNPSETETNGDTSNEFNSDPNSSGSVGVVLPDLADGSFPTPIPPPNSVFQCEPLDGKIKCWGNNSFGQLGNGTTQSFLPEAEATFVQIEDGMALSDVIDFDSRDSHSCAQTQSGDLYCWGHNLNLRFGIGLGSFVVYATKVASNITEFLLLPDGTLYRTTDGAAVQCIGTPENCNTIQQNLPANWQEPGQQLTEAQGMISGA